MGDEIFGHPFISHKLRNSLLCDILALVTDLEGRIACMDNRKNMSGKWLFLKGLLEKMGRLEMKYSSYKVGRANPCSQVGISIESYW